MGKGIASKLLKETFFHFKEVRKFIVRQAPSDRTLYRWHRYGKAPFLDGVRDDEASRVKLEAAYVNGSWGTSVEAVYRFYDKINGVNEL